MTETKKVAKSLCTILESPLVETILDRSSDIFETSEAVKGFWGFDLFSRKPSAAYDADGVFKGTTLDMACFLYELAKRDAVITIPEYKTITETKFEVGQTILSKPRTGKMIGIGANKDFLSFNITIYDTSILNEDGSTGDYRTFTLVDKDGKLSKNWNNISFQPTDTEVQFLKENNIVTENSIYFKNFIHPNRWVSIFGRHYVITKMLIDRLEDECKHIFSEMKRLQAIGIKYPEGKGPQSTSHGYVYGGDVVSKKFTAFEMLLYVPESKYYGNYKTYSDNQRGLLHAYEDRKYLLHNIIPKLRFMTRASEYAHYFKQDLFPSWVQNVKWEDGFKLPRGRKVYHRLKLFQDKVGEYSISLLKREYTKTAKVKDE